MIWLIPVLEYSTIIGTTYTSKHFYIPNDYIKVLMTMYRLVKRVVMESLEMVGKTAWQKDLECGLEGVGWRDVGIEGLGRLSIYDRNRTHAERHCVERDEEGVGG